MGNILCNIKIKTYEFNYKNIKKYIFQKKKELCDIPIVQSEQVNVDFYQDNELFIKEYIYLFL